ncbi:2287_t:CDS:2, partial [Gigaspora margarita]
MPNTYKLNLPLLVLKEILEILANDTKTLHSCIQVNYEWFHEASSLLWYDPFSNKTKSYLAIGTYMQEMSFQEKQIIKKYFNISRFEFKSLLPYSSFLQLININNFMDACQSLSKLAIFNCLFENEDEDQHNLIDQIPIKQLVIYNSSAPVIKLILLCNSSLETIKITGPLCRDKIEKIFEIAFECCPDIVDFSIGLIKCKLDYLDIYWAPSLQYLILYRNQFVVNLKNLKLGDYLEKLAKSLPMYIKVIKIWMVLQGYEDEVNLDDLCRFFSNINSRRLFVLLEIAVPYNAQVVSKSIQFDEFGKPEEIESKNIK